MTPEMREAEAAYRLRDQTKQDLARLRQQLYQPVIAKDIPKRPVSTDRRPTHDYLMFGD